MSEKRLQKLEESLAHQDQQIADLSEMLILQGREIAKLGRDLKKLNDKIELHKGDSSNQEQSASEFAAQNKPPHW